MADHHTALLDQVLDPDSHVLSEEMRVILHAIRNEANESRLARATMQMQINATNTLITDHINACSERKEQMETLIEIVRALEGSMTFAKWVKSFLMYVSGV